LSKFRRVDQIDALLSAPMGPQETSPPLSVAHEDVRPFQEHANLV
jgi:hypothetical protein